MARLRTALQAVVWQKGVDLSPDMRQFLARRLERIYDVLRERGAVATDGTRRHVFALVLIEEPLEAAPRAPVKKEPDS